MTVEPIRVVEIENSRTRNAQTRNAQTKNAQTKNALSLIRGVILFLVIVIFGSFIASGNTGPEVPEPQDLGTLTDDAPPPESMEQRPAPELEREDSVPMRPTSWTAEAWEQCVDAVAGSGANGLVRNAALRLCVDVGPAEERWQGLAVESCGEGSDMHPRITLDGELLLHTQPRSRHSVVDSLDPRALERNGISTAVGTLQRELVIFDAGTHARFVIDLVHQMLDVPTNGHQITFVDLEAQRTDATPVGYVTASTLAREINALLDRQEASYGTVITMSVGGYNCGEDHDGLRFAVRRAIEAGFWIVVAAGDDGTSQPIWLPQQSPPTQAEFDLSGKVITVGSMEPNGTRSCFSNHGFTTDWWAVGEEVWVQGWGSWSGTAFAAAQVAGGLAGSPPLDSHGIADTPEDLLVTAQPVAVPVVITDGTHVDHLVVLTDCHSARSEYLPMPLVAKY